MSTYIIIASAMALIAAIVIVMIMLRRVVPTNMVHIVQSRKTTTPYGRGKGAGNTYYEWPYWVPVFGVTVTKFPESIFQVSLQDYEAYDSARLPFVVDVTAFFRVDNAETAAQRVASFDELNTQLISVLQGSVRRILATNKLEEIMQERSSFGRQFTDEVQNQIKEWGVVPVKTIEFMDLRDSSKGHVIANIMAKEQSRIEKESRVAVAENIREAELKEIDAKRVVEVQRQDAEQQVGLRIAEKDKTVGMANEVMQQEIKKEAKSTAERDMDVKKVQDVRQAEIVKDVATVKAEQERTVRNINAEADKSVAVVQAQGDKESTIQIAQGNLEAAKLDAEGIQVKGEAQAAAEKAMLMAPVDTQISLAKEIGANDGYQKYLITIEQVKVSQVVGVEMAKAMQSAELKVIANAGDVQTGVAKLGDLFTPTGGTNLTGMLAALSQTEEGKKLLDSVTRKLGE